MYFHMDRLLSVEHVDTNLYLELFQWIASMDIVEDCITRLSNKYTDRVSISLKVKE